MLNVYDLRKSIIPHLIAFGFTFIFNSLVFVLRHYYRESLEDIGLWFKFGYTDAFDRCLILTTACFLFSLFLQWQFSKKIFKLSVTTLSFIIFAVIFSLFIFWSYFVEKYLTMLFLVIIMLIPLPFYWYIFYWVNLKIEKRYTVT
jgi:hypothetical protein